MYDCDAARLDAIADEHIGDRLGDSDEPVSVGPVAPTAQMEIDPAGHYEGDPGERRAKPGQSEGVCVVGVDEGCSVTKLLEDGPDHPGVEASFPRRGMYPNSRGLKPAGQLAIAAGDDDLLLTQATELAREQPYLPLTATPLST